MAPTCRLPDPVTRSVGWTEPCAGKVTPATCRLSLTTTRVRAGTVDMQATSLAVGTVLAPPPSVADQLPLTSQAVLTAPVQ